MRVHFVILIKFFIQIVEQSKITVRCRLRGDDLLGNEPIRYLCVPNKL